MLPQVTTLSSQHVSLLIMILYKNPTFTITMFRRCATSPGSCGSVPADWTSAPPVVRSGNYTRPPSSAQPDAERAHSSDHADYFRSRDYGYDARDFEYGDDELDASAYGLTSSAKPEVRPSFAGSPTGPEVRPDFERSSAAKPEVRPLVVDVYAVSETQRRRHDAGHVGYSWSRDGERPMTSSSDGDYDDDEAYDDDYDEYSDVAGHVTSYLGRPGSRGHESSLGQSGWRREVDKASDDGSAAVRPSSAGRRGCVVAMASAAAVATVTMVAFR